MIFLRFTTFIALFCSLFLSTFVSTAQADPKPTIWSWGLGHYDNLEFDRRYIDDSKAPHNYRWQEQDWSPEQWIEARGSAEALLSDFYHANFIKKQFEVEGIPALSLGQGWMNLSMQERVRVLRVVDHMYEITKNDPNGTILLYHEKMDAPLGAYTIHGLQLQ